MHSIKRKTGEVLEVTLTGKVTTDDYEAVIPAVESSIDTQSEVRFLCDLSAVEAVEPSAIWTDVVFDMRHRTETQRVAIIADKRWQRWATRLFLVPKQTSIRVFDASRYELAEGWVRDEAAAA